MRQPGCGPVRCGSLPAVANVLYVRTQQFSDAPGLRHTASRTVRLVSIEDLWDLSDALALKISLQGGKPVFRLHHGHFGVIVHPQVGAYKRTQKPRPDRSLVVGAVAVILVSFVAPAIFRIVN